MIANHDHTQRPGDHLRIGEAMFADTSPVNDALRQAIETLESLPETKDGARVIPHVSRVWHPVYGEGWLAARLHGSFYTKEHPKGPATLVPISECYSTQTAAQAAATTKED
jgi:hypothetical protein